MQAKVLTVSDGVAQGSRDDKSGRALADGNVARGLYSRAIGYSHEATRVMFNRGEPVLVPVAVAWTFP